MGWEMGFEPTIFGTTKKRSENCPRIRAALKIEKVPKLRCFSSECEIMKSRRKWFVLCYVLGKQLGNESLTVQRFPMYTKQNTKNLLKIERIHISKKHKFEN